MEYWVYEFWDRFLEMHVEPVIKTWSLNSNLRIGTSPELEAWHKRNIFPKTLDVRRVSSRVEVSKFSLQTRALIAEI